MSATTPTNAGIISNIFDLSDFKTAALQAILDYELNKAKRTYEINHNLNKFCLTTNSLVDNVDPSQLDPVQAAMYPEAEKDLKVIHHICSIPNNSSSQHPHLNVNGSILKAAAFFIKHVCSDPLLLSALNNAYLYENCEKYDSHSVAEIYATFTPADHVKIVDTTTNFFMANPDYMAGLTTFVNLFDL